MTNQEFFDNYFGKNCIEAYLVGDDIVGKTIVTRTVKNVDHNFFISHYVRSSLDYKISNAIVFDGEAEVLFNIIKDTGDFEKNENSMKNHRYFVSEYNAIEKIGNIPKALMIEIQLICVIKDYEENFAELMKELIRLFVKEYKLTKQSKDLISDIFWTHNLF